MKMHVIQKRRNMFYCMFCLCRLTELLVFLQNGAAGATAILFRSSPMKSRKKLARSVIYKVATHARGIRSVTDLAKIATLTSVSIFKLSDIDI